MKNKPNPILLQLRGQRSRQQIIVKSHLRGWTMTTKSIQHAEAGKNITVRTMGQILAIYLDYQGEPEELVWSLLLQALTSQSAANDDDEGKAA